jgi:hypothetical protein
MKHRAVTAMPLGSSKNVFEESSDKVTREKEFVLKNIPHEEVFRDCTILRIFFDSCVAQARQANRHEMLSERSEFIE